MNARRTAGLVALVSGALLVVALVAAAIAGPGFAWNDTAWHSAYGMMGGGNGPGMMGGYGHMNGMGPGMMGFGNTGPAASAIPGAPEVRVQASNFAFTPSEIRLPANADVNLVLVNATNVAHDLTVPTLGIHVVAGPGQTSTVGLRRLPGGRYDAFCSVPGHADLGMRGVLIVE